MILSGILLPLLYWTELPNSRTLFRIMSEQQLFKDKIETNQFVQVLQRYLPFWPLFVITISIGLAISWLRLRSQPRIYVAAATVLLKDPQKGGGDSKVLEALNIFSEKKIC